VNKICPVEVLHVGLLLMLAVTMGFLRVELALVVVLAGGVLFLSSRIRRGESS